MIQINNLSISNDKTKIYVDVETNEGETITAATLWNHNTFKNYSLGVDISFKLEQINNLEVFTLNASEINTQYFNGIYFIEFTTSYEDEECSQCQNTIIGIAANFNDINEYILNLILELNICINCNKNLDEIINLNLSLEGICTALKLGYYEEAIYLYRKLLKLLGSNLTCTNCTKLINPTLINGLNYGTLDNTLILI
jgi:hypothetical protein